MCGRYASSRPVDDLLVRFEVEEPPEQALPPSWNVAPTDPVYVVLQRHDRRRLTTARWGLVPSWAKDVKGGAKMINARRETLASKPAFRSAYQRRRCLLPADGYYEWQPLAAGTRSSRRPGGTALRKQPWFLTSRDGLPLAMAGLYELWRSPDGELVRSCTIITTDAADDHGDIHDRTPLLVEPGDWARWLDPELADPGDDLLHPGTPGVLDAWPVGPEVGNVRSQGPQLAQPLAQA